VVLSIMLGTGYVMLRPFALLLKRPVTCSDRWPSVCSTLQFIRTAMLGNTDPA
jgi:hypothetical protein